MQSLAHQGSLLDGEQPGFDPMLAGVERCHLADDAWIDMLAHWVTGADRLFSDLVEHLPWEHGVERIHGKDVPRPRLTASLPATGLPPHLAFWEAVGGALSQHYGVRFERIGVNLYRDGSDSVAWHGDRVARDLPSAIVAIVSLGEPRTFRWKPADGGPSSGRALGHGDLFVMGGSFQRTWRHTVPKVKSAGPRISVTFRHAYPPRPI